MPLRQTIGFVESLPRLVGPNWTLPDFGTLSRRQKTLAVIMPYRSVRCQLQVLVDSTGTRTVAGVGHRIVQRS